MLLAFFGQIPFCCGQVQRQLASPSFRRPDRLQTGERRRRPEAKDLRRRDARHERRWLLVEVEAAGPVGVASSSSRRLVPGAALQPWCRPRRRFLARTAVVQLCAALQVLKVQERQACGDIDGSLSQLGERAGF